MSDTYLQYLKNIKPRVQIQLMDNRHHKITSQLTAQITYPHNNCLKS